MFIHMIAYRIFCFIYLDFHVCHANCSHIKTILAKILMNCLSNYEMVNKISSGVVDNCTTNDAMMGILVDIFGPKSLVLLGAHILNLVGNGRLDMIDCAIENIQECVAFWTSTPKKK